MKISGIYRLGWVETAGFAIAMFYSFFTNHIWEDFFITFRHSQNLVEGYGLLYNQGERVHGFTSPLGVLVPALLYWVSGTNTYVVSLWLYRALGAALFGFAAGQVCRLLREEKQVAVGGLIFLSFFFFDVKSIAYSVNGMETAFMIFFLALALDRLRAFHTGRWVGWGVACAGLAWTRPDSFVYVVILVAIGLTYRWVEPRRDVANLMRAAVLSLVLYVPWLMAATLYYGSPIPNTILAKGASFNPMLLPDAVPTNLLAWSEVPFFKALASPFLPIYYFLGGWPWWMMYWAEALGLFVASYWLWPSTDRLGRACSLGFLLSVLYLASIPPFPWYLPPAAVFAWVALGSLAAHMVGRFVTPHQRWVPAAGLAAVTGFAIVHAWLSISNAYTMKVQQAEIEFGNRRAIGLWLREHVAPSQTIMLEPLGYIGYFSQSHMTDYPGLVSPGIVRLRRQLSGLGYQGVIQATNPQWLVLRPLEVSDYVRDNYEAVKTFDARERLDAYTGLYGRGYLDFDSVFTIYKLRDATPTLSERREHSTFFLSHLPKADLIADRPR